MERFRFVVAVVLLSQLSACAGGGDVSSSDPTDSAGGEETSEALPDNCALITAEEATTLAGYDLELGEDSILGCGFLSPGSSVADIVVNTARLDGDAAAVAADGFPDATDIIAVDVGGDTVAVTTPSGDTIASIITGEGGRFLELAIVFVGIDPDDTARIEEAAHRAVTALERWDG